MKKNSRPLRVPLMALAAIAATAALPCLAAQGTAAEPSVADQSAARTAYIERSFEKIDTNHDGHIDKQEWQTFMVGYLDKQKRDFDESFKAADKNGDRKLSRKEAETANPLLYKYFDDIDTNGDGFITPEEIRSAMVQKQMESVDAPEAATPDRK